MDTFQPPEGFTEDSLFSRRADKPVPRWLKRRRKYRHQQKNVVFEKLPRPYRRAKAVSLRWQIRTDPNGQGVYTTHDILPGSRDWPAHEDGTLAPSYWADLYFMSARPIREGRFYNAVATSVVMVAVREIEDLAEAAIKAQLSEEDREASRLRAFSRPSKSGSEMIFATRVGLSSLGGLTRQGAQAQWLRDRWDQLATLVEVRPSAEFLPDYAYGIGLNLVSDQATVDTRTLPAIVQQFLARGEVAYTDEPVDLVLYLDAIRGLLGTILWRWDAHQARAEGREPEEPDEALHPYFHFESKPIRL